MFLRKLFFTLIMILYLNLAFTQPKPGSALALEGFKFDERIKGPKHKRSKIIEVMVDEYGYYLATTYKGPKSYLTLIIYELYTWQIKGTYKFKSRAELYNSYFSEDGTYMYLNTDIYKNRYTGIDLNTGEMKILNCEETPKGCQYIEPKPYETSGYTMGENFYIFMDENRKNDLKVYRNKDMIIANSYLEDDNWGEEDVVEEPEEEKKPEEEVKVEKPKLEEKEVFITLTEIEELKNGIVLERQGVKVMLKNDSNASMMNKTEGDIRYVLLTLVDLSKLSFGNRIEQNHTTINLKE